MNELITYLNSIKSMSPHLIERIRKTFSLRHLQKGDYILKPGDRKDTVFFVVVGLLRYFTMEPSGDLSKCFFQKNDLLIDGTSMVAGEESLGFIQAVVRTDVISCSKIELNQLYRDFPEFEHHGRVLTHRCFIRAYTFLDNIRMKSAKERYLFLRRDFPDLVLSVPNRQLASFLGINEITLSRVRNVKGSR